MLNIKLIIYIIVLYAFIVPINAYSVSKNATILKKFVMF